MDEPAVGGEVGRAVQASDATVYRGRYLSLASFRQWRAVMAVAPR